MKKPNPKLTWRDFPEVIELFEKGSQLRKLVTMHFADKMLRETEVEKVHPLDFHKSGW